MRTVAIIGAGSGIGRAIAEAFIVEGDRVFISDLLEDPVQDVAEQLGERASASRVDVSDCSAVTAFFQRAHEEAGRLDVAVNAAGIFDGYAGVLETTEDLWRRIIEINLTGSFFASMAAAQIMKGQGSGRIINIGSVASHRGVADGIAYTAAKHGMLGMTRRLAVDVGRFGITANLICPGVIPTGLRANSEQILGELSPNQQQGVGVSPELIDVFVPAKRTGKPDEVAAVAVFLASEGAAYVNGESIAVDGGWMAA